MTKIDHSSKNVLDTLSIDNYLPATEASKVALSARVGRCTPVLDYLMAEIFDHVKISAEKGEFKFDASEIPYPNVGFDITSEEIVWLEDQIIDKLSRAGYTNRNLEVNKFTSRRVSLSGQICWDTSVSASTPTPSSSLWLRSLKYLSVIAGVIGLLSIGVWLVSSK